MKKELVALALLLLILLGNLWNQRRLEGLTAQLRSSVEDAYNAVEAQDWSKAAEDAQAAERDWLDAGAYTHIFIRHTDIDAVTAAFCGYRGAIAGQDKGNAFQAYLLLVALLDGLKGMERLSPGSIL